MNLNQSIKELIQEYVILQTGHGRTLDQLSVDESITLGQRLEGLERSSRLPDSILVMVKDLMSFLHAQGSNFPKTKEELVRMEGLVDSFMVLCKLLQNEDKSLLLNLDQEVLNHVCAIQQHLNHPNISTTIEQLLKDALKSWHGTINVKVSSQQRPAAISGPPKKN